MKIVLVAAFVLVIFLTGRIGFWLALLSGLGFVVGAVMVLLVAGRMLGKKAAPASEQPAGAVEASDASPASSAESVASAADPVELTPAIEALQAGHHQQAIQLAQPYVDDPRSKVRIDALRLTGFGHAGLGQYALAYPCWLAIAEAEPTSLNYLNVTSTAAVIGRFDEAEAAYAQCERLVTQEGGGDPAQGLIFHGQNQANFLASLAQAERPDLAFKYLQPLANFYRSLHITDSHFLYVRNMPFFEVFLEQSLPLVRKVLDESALVAWYRTVYDAVDEEGKALFATYQVPH
ncbi:hypothetical protein [Dyella tabacisoli]|uniref:Tetratricopeptide repeat protein n=1 Tax=Dyella tabacisoli TaxID=2282381 RepID=A0A369UNX3_9GAMM|nr:hypothetical protein [Dyella tabacisoli]RDD81320.1 hypothetical protein DVJ77_13510 [Dyella tabacisoli]